MMAGVMASSVATMAGGAGVGPWPGLLLRGSLAAGEHVRAVDGREGRASRGRRHHCDDHSVRPGDGGTDPGVRHWGDCPDCDRGVVGGLDSRCTGRPTFSW